MPVHALRSLDDARRLRAAVERDRDIAIVGGGLIGMEVAASLTQFGCRVTVVEAQDRVLARCVGHSVASFIAETHREKGVRVLTGRSVIGTLEAGGSGWVVLDDGSRLPADRIVAAVGVVPNVELAERAGLPVANGIVVDEHGRTSDPAIYAVGDATFQSWRQRRLESWANANAQAAAAAAHILGQPRPCTEPEWFWTDQYDLNVQTVGAPEGEEIVRGDPATNAFTVFHLRGGALVGATAVNAGRDIAIARRALASGASVDPAALADLARPVKRA